MSKPRIAILGAGPAGLGAAWQLARQNKAEAIVLERGEDVGGNAGSFEVAGLQVDYGSHRLHPACRENILDDIRGLLGEDLLKRPRHGRIRLRGKWIHFPLKPVDLVVNMPWSFGFGVMGDALRKALPANGNGHEPTFASVLEKGLGGTICRDFYFPYARKIWGVQPEELSPIQAQRRVSAGSLTKMVRKVLRLKTGTSPNSGYFYYPRHGYGQISRAISDAAQKAGAEVRLNTNVKSIQLGTPIRLDLEHGAQTSTIEADRLWSTIPLAVLAQIVKPTASREVLEAARQNESRAMILIYLVLDQNQFTEYDAHYFPDTEIGLTRLSEPKNYSDRTETSNKTVLCGELPCNVGDQYWRSTDAELGDLVKDSLARCGLSITSAVLEVTSRRLSHAYPIYRRGYEAHFNILDKWASGLPGVLSFGRQGLFAHDNTHHALAMAYAAVDCLDAESAFSGSRWSEYRHEFEKHVVED